MSGNIFVGVRARVKKILERLSGEVSKKNVQAAFLNLAPDDVTFTNQPILGKTNREGALWEIKKTRKCALIVFTCKQGILVDEKR